MEIEKFELWTLDYLSGRLNTGELKEFEAFLESHEEHLEHFQGLFQTWHRIEETKIPEPTAQMDLKFYDMLHHQMARNKISNTNSVHKFLSFLESLWQPKYAYGLLLLGLGLGLGYFIRPETIKIPIKTTLINDNETQGVREKLVLTLLEQPSANQRLQGISEVNKITKIDERIIQALLQTLNHDSNVNVRLAAIESLTNYLENPLVREGLVQSIVKQDSPIVQITLANLMVALQEKKSIEPFRTLMRTKELDISVKQKLETSIKSII